MPWCDACSRYLTPSSIGEDGRCPSCSRPVDATRPSPNVSTTADDVADESTPWHFKLLVVAVVVYLGWRFVDIFM